jgi:hypothetical protein
MPKGYTKSGKPRAPWGSKTRQPADGGAVTQPAPTVNAPVMEPVRDQVKQMSGFNNLEELKAAVPESTATVPTPERKPRQKRVLEDADPLMNDPKYRAAIGNMTAFGGKKVVASGFATAASALRDEKFKLNSEEEQVWDEFFYVVSKRSNFDPTSPWFLAIYAVVMILTQLGSRLWERSGHKGLFEMFSKLGPKQPQKTNAPRAEEVA